MEQVRLWRTSSGTPLFRMSSLSSLSPLGYCTQKNLHVIICSVYKMSLSLANVLFLEKNLLYTFNLMEGLVYFRGYQLYMMDHELTNWSK